MRLHGSPNSNLDTQTLLAAFNLSYCLSSSSKHPLLPIHPHRWADELQGTQQGGNRGYGAAAPAAVRAAHVAPAQSYGGSGASLSVIPATQSQGAAPSASNGVAPVYMCQCGAAAEVRTSNSAANPGRQYYKCSKPVRVRGSMGGGGYSSLLRCLLAAAV